MKFINLHAQQKRIKQRIDARIQKVLESGAYIMGPEVSELERSLEDFSGAKHCVSCANGTDALQLAIMTLGLEQGDAVFCPSFTFAATAEVVPFFNATVIFVDVDTESYNISADSLLDAIALAHRSGLRPKGLIVVDLFGLPADYDKLEAIAANEGLWVISDSAQAFGASYKGQRSGTFGDITTTSFFPAKPLGCYGDGGALFTNDDAMAEVIQSLRVHGKGDHKYENVRVGLNSRLDTIQAAILLEKMAIFEEEIGLRQEVAARYHARLGACNELSVPIVPDHSISVWAQYTIALDGNLNRQLIQSSMQEVSVPTAVYYAIPLHMQKAYRNDAINAGRLPVTEDLASRVLSLPMHPYLSEEDQDQVVEALIEAVG